MIVKRYLIKMYDCLPISEKYCKFAIMNADHE